MVYIFTFMMKDFHHFPDDSWQQLTADTEHEQWTALSYFGKQQPFEWDRLSQHNGQAAAFLLYLPDAPLHTMHLDWCPSHTSCVPLSLCLKFRYSSWQTKQFDWPLAFVPGSQSSHICAAAFRRAGFSLHFFVLAYALHLLAHRRFQSSSCVASYAPCSFLLAVYLSCSVFARWALGDSGSSLR